jgi:DNA topoisomerase-1
MKNLVIVESPTKARTLSKFLGRDYRIEATMGHVRDLPEKKLGIEIKQVTDNYQFIPEYQIIPERKQRVAELKKIADGSSSIILATDLDREGEAIAYHVFHVISSNEKLKMENKKFQRIVFHEITKQAIKDALLHPRDIDMQLVDAQQGRRILDRLVGYKLSPLLWNKLGKRWLSAGRVQSVAVRLIVEREREIESFKPQEYWLIDVELAKISEKDQSFLARLVQIDGEKAELKNRQEAEEIVNNLKTASYKVSNVEIKDALRFPLPPFTTSTLQQMASTRFGWSAKRVMKGAQTLYEEGLITYHRTDSTNIALEAIKMARDYINSIYGTPFLPAKPKFYKTASKVAQEAHEAIRPTDIRILGDYDIKKLNNDQKKNIKIFPEDLGRDAQLLYSLIWKRFLACQMKEAVFEQTTIHILAEKYINNDPAGHQIVYLLRATGERIKFDGWLTLYGKIQDSEFSNQNNNRENNDTKQLPSLVSDELLQLIQVLPQQKFTQPLPRFTEATLIKALEEKGIGRPSTYAPIISTIQDRKYVEKIERKFHPTDLGFAVNDFLIKYFPDVFAVSFTAKMEDELDEIANGHLKWNQVISDFYAPFYSKLDLVFKQADRVKMDLGTTNEKCPQCGSQLVIRLSKYGKFLACLAYPKCKFTKNIVEKIEIKCPRCNADMLIKRTRRGKQFYGCSNYPKCTFAAWKKEDIK